jgi:hypothetical protein
MPILIKLYLLKILISDSIDKIIFLFRYLLSKEVSLLLISSSDFFY